MKDRSFYFWLLLGISLRIIAAGSHFSWHHPDEWFQTVEFANFHSQGWMFWSQEVALHLRNQLLPAILTPVLSLTYFLTPNSMGMKFWSVQFFSSLLDLLGFASIWIIFWNQIPSFKSNQFLRHATGAVWILSWFLLETALKSSGEHYSILAFLIALGFLEMRHFALAGFFAIAVGAFRYPSLLLSIGMILSVIFHHSRKKNRKNILRFLAGSLGGIVLLGLPDFFIYGRPWESFWMYLQYNIFTDLGKTIFGTQSASVYFDYFKGHFGKTMMMGSLLLLPVFVIGWIRRLLKAEAWALAFLFYLVGHLIVGHKEPRFMIPLESLLVFGTLLELQTWFTKLRSTHPGRLDSFRWTRFILLPTFGVQLLLLLRFLWGETWIASGTYRELPQHLKSNTCAILTASHPCMAESGSNPNARKNQ